MTEQPVVESIQETESVCTTCIHFIELEGGFFCKLLGAFVSEKTLVIPCDFKETVQ